MLGLIVWSSHMRTAIVFFYTFVWMPWFRFKEAILSVAGVFSLASPPQLDESVGTNLPVGRYDELRRSKKKAEEMCAICLTEFAREDGVCELPGCGHLFHGDCIEKWVERNNFTCPLCRCFFNVENCHGKLEFVVPDDPSCLYYFLQ